MLNDKKLKKLRNFVFEFVGLCVLALLIFFVLMSWAEKAVSDSDSWLFWAQRHWRSMIFAAGAFLIPVVCGACFILNRTYKMLDRKRRCIPALILDAQKLVLNAGGGNEPVCIARCDIMGISVIWGKARDIGQHYIAPENLVVFWLNNPAGFIRRRQVSFCARFCGLT